MTIKSASDLAGMRAVGKLVALALQEMSTQAQPGMTTEQLDEIGERFLRRRGARSAPQMTYDFPGFSCISVNDEVVHGVPSTRVLQPGDVLKIDVTAELGGFVADTAATVILPPVAPNAQHLVDCARAAFDCAIAVALPNARINEVGRTVEDEVERWGHAVIREMCGHGVGHGMHEPPSVPNFFSPFTPGRLHDGLVIALEPIVAEWATEIYEGEDGWTVITKSGCLAAHYEHTIVICNGRPEILTAA